MDVRVLGSIEVSRDGGPVALPVGKQRALLAYLLIHRNQVVLRDSLIDGLWGAHPPATATKNLQVLVSQLRRALGNDAITTVGGGYLLALPDGATDADRYERSLEAGRGELDQGRAADAQATFERALAMWRGAPYADVAYEDFAADEIARLQARRLVGEEARYEAMLAAGRHADAVAGLEQLVSRNPFRERLTGELMLALHRSGRRAAALESYDALRRRMSEELGIEPGEQLRSLHASILQDDSAPADQSLTLARPGRPRRRRAALVVLAGGIALIAAAALAALHSSGGDSLASVAGDHVGSIDPGSGRLTAQYAVGATPTAVAAHGGALWTLNGDAGTISRVDLATGTTMERSPGVIPTDLAYGGSTLWVGYVTRNPDNDTVRAGVLDLDPHTLRERRRLALKGELGTVVNQTSVTLVSFGNDALYVASPMGQVLRVDPRRLKITAGVPLEVNAFGAGLGALWVVPGNGRSFANTTSASGARVVRLNPVTLRNLGGTSVSSPSGLFDLAFGDGAVWAAEPFAGQVWRIDPGPPFETSSFDVGNSAGSVTFGGGRVWAADGVDGSVAQIDPDSGKLTTVPVGGVPQGVAYGDGQVLVTVAGNTGSSRYRGLPTLPLSTCGAVRYQGGGAPDMILASDMPLDRPSAGLTTPVVSAIEQVLREHRYRAGRYRVAYQSCDDSTEQLGTANSGKCQANARSFADTASVIGVIGTFNSDCAKAELPILSSASDPVALVSPSNSYPGLTTAAPGVIADEPQRYYPGGSRQYFRVYPRDDQPAQAEAVMAQRLHLRRVFVFIDDPRSRQWQIYAQGFAERARALGIDVLGPSARPAGIRFGPLVRRLQRQDVDGVMLAGSFGSLNYLLTRQLRQAMGQSVAIFGTPDFYAFAQGDPNMTGVYTVATGVTSPAQLGPAGRQFWQTFQPSQSRNDDLQFAPYAAQAAELLLAAIARSDGTRGSVIAELRRTRVSGGILGDFSFTKNGDMSVASLPVFRLTPRPRPVAVLRVPG